MKDKEKQTLKFSVIDNKTGEYPDLYNIVLKEDWAKDLMYCDMEGFSINEDGQLILSDECGKFVYCPNDRFTVVFEDRVILSKEEYDKLKYTWITDSDAYKKGSNETAEKIYKDLKLLVPDNALGIVTRYFKEIIGVEIKE